jgi:hypothetical protein
MNFRQLSQKFDRESTGEGDSKQDVGSSCPYSPKGLKRRRAPPKNGAIVGTEGCGHQIYSAAHDDGVLAKVLLGKPLPPSAF